MLGFFAGGGESARVEVPRIGGTDGASATSGGEGAAAAGVGTSALVALDASGRDGDRNRSNSRRRGAQLSTAPRGAVGALALENGAAAAPEGTTIGEAAMATEPESAVGESVEPRAADGDPERADGGAGGAGVGDGVGVAPGAGAGGGDGGGGGAGDGGDGGGAGGGDGGVGGDRGEDREEGVAGAAADAGAAPDADHWQPDPGADLPGYESTPADRLLDSVYGDHVHSNDGRHLDGGVST